MSISPGQQRGQPRAELGDEAERDAIEIGWALPVVGVLLEHQLLVAHPLHELEGAGPDRLGGQRLHALLLERLGRHEEDVGGGHPIDQPGPGLVGDEPHGVVVDDLDLLHLRPARQVVRLVRRVLDVVHRRLHGGGVERLAVVELDALAQGELPRRVVDHLPAGGEHRRGLVGLGIAVHQAIVDVLDLVIGGPVHDGVGQERARLGGEGDDHLLRARAVLGLGGQGPAGAGKAEQHGQQRERCQLPHTGILLRLGGTSVTASSGPPCGNG